MCSIAFYCILLYGVVQCWTLLYSIECWILLNWIDLCFDLLYCVALHNIVLHNTELCCTLLCYTELPCVVLPVFYFVEPYCNFAKYWDYFHLFINKQDLKKIKLSLIFKWNKYKPLFEIIEFILQTEQIFAEMCDKKLWKKLKLKYLEVKLTPTNMDLAC